MARIKTYTKPEAIRAAVFGSLKLIEADIREHGKCPLNEMRDGKNTGRKIPAWAQIVHLAPECFPGTRPEGWLKEMQEELGIVIIGGTPLTGPLTATVKEFRKRDGNAD